VVPATKRVSWLGSVRRKRHPLRSLTGSARNHLASSHSLHQARLCRLGIMLLEFRPLEFRKFSGHETTDSGEGLRTATSNQVERAAPADIPNARSMKKGRLIATSRQVTIGWNLRPLL